MESGVPTPDPPAEPGGLIVVVRDDPADAGRAMAGDFGAEFAVGGLETEAALDRLESGPVHDRGATLHALEGLETAMRRAEGVLDRTRAAASERLTSSLNTRLAIHPDTIRRAGAELLAAEEDERTAQARLVRWTARRRAAAVGLGVVGLSVGAAVGWFVSPVIGALVAAFVLAAAALAAMRIRGAAAPLPPAQFCAAVALARRRWVQVAGADSDPADVEAVIHRYDPQDPVVAPLVGEHPAVRAAMRVAAQRREAWVAAWRATVTERARVRRPTEIELLHQQKIELWLATPSHQRSRPPVLVVASPYAELSDERARLLHRRLHDLPPGKRVVVILGPEPSLTRSQPSLHHAEVQPRSAGRPTDPARATG
ncbi:MAG: hypothetical protein ACR2LA_00145 [Acidimicrobiales bacterium]